MVQELVDRVVSKCEVHKDNQTTSQPDAHPGLQVEYHPGEVQSDGGNLNARVSCHKATRQG